jgi:hypothetical protein
LVARRLGLGGRYGRRDAENHDGDQKKIPHRAFSPALISPAGMQDNARTAKKENEV